MKVFGILSLLLLLVGYLGVSVDAMGEEEEMGMGKEKEMGEEEMKEKEKEFKEKEFRNFVKLCKLKGPKVLPSLPSLRDAFNNNLVVPVPSNLIPEKAYPSLDPIELAGLLKLHPRSKDEISDLLDNHNAEYVKSRDESREHDERLLAKYELNEYEYDQLERNLKNDGEYAEYAEAENKRRDSRKKLDLDLERRFQDLLQRSFQDLNKLLLLRDLQRSFPDLQDNQRYFLQDNDNKKKLLDDLLDDQLQKLKNLLDDQLQKKQLQNQLPRDLDHDNPRLDLPLLDLDNLP